MSFVSRNHPQQVKVRGALSSVDDRGTDPTLFAALNERFGGFQIDVAASDANTKCKYWFTSEDDALELMWPCERIWCNPPYSNIQPWVAKAWEQWRTGDIDLIVMLLPANRTEQRWWQDIVEPFRDKPGSPLRVEFLRGRQRFVAPGAESIGPNERPPFGCCLLIWAAAVSVGDAIAQETE